MAAPAITAADDYPEGCVDCHIETDDGDFRIATLLAEKGHTRINEGGDQVPQGCAYCHSADDEGTASSIRTLMHMIHYEEPDDNLFVSESRSDCRHCHSLDSAEGTVGIKSGKANWLVEEQAADE